MKNALSDLTLLRARLILTEVNKIALKVSQRDLLLHSNRMNEKGIYLVRIGDKTDLKYSLLLV
jgi:hypothetical protein